MWSGAPCEKVPSVIFPNLLLPGGGHNSKRSSTHLPRPMGMWFLKSSGRRTVNTFRRSSAMATLAFSWLRALPNRPLPAVAPSRAGQPSPAPGGRHAGQWKIFLSLQIPSTVTTTA